MSSPLPSHFRTTETGDLPCPHGTLKLVTVKSPALSARADVTRYIADQAKPGALQEAADYKSTLHVHDAIP